MKPAGGELAASAPRFVGRERELASLARALSRPPAVVLVEGEAGIGKSRLLHEFLAAGLPAAGRSAAGRSAARPAGAGFRATDAQDVLVAACPPYRESLTLGPVVDALRQVGGRVGALRLSALAGALRPLFPEWTDDLPPSPEPLDDPSAARHRLFRALAELVGALPAGVLVVEDVHWADEATMQFLLFLASQPPAPGLSLLVTFRPEDLDAGSLLPRLSSRLPAGTTQVRIVLEPLDQAGTAGLVSSMLDDEPLSDEFAGFLHARTEGLPLAIEESVRVMRDRADLLREDGQWVRRGLAEMRVPPTVRDGVLARAQRLEPAARRLLDAAAVFAEPTDEAIVRGVAGMREDQPPAGLREDQTLAGLREDQALAGLREALASGLLAEDDRGRLAFRHALMGRAVYEAMPGAERRRLHLAAGHALAGTEPLPAVQLIRHFREAGETGKWVEYAELAAERASASNDHTAATTILNEAIVSADPPPPVRERLAVRLGTAALSRNGDIDALHHRVIDTLDRVLTAGDAGPARGARGEIRHRLGRLLLQRGDFERGMPELERAAAGLDHNPREAAVVMTCLGLPLGPWPASFHRTWLRRAGEIDTTALAPGDRLLIAVHRAMALLHLGEEEGWAVAAGFPDRASTVTERQHLARGWATAGQAAVLWGRYADARRLLAAAADLADATGLERVCRMIDSIRADLDWRTGAWDGLAGVADRNGGDDGSPPSDLRGCRVAGLLSAAQGRRAEAEERLRLALDEARRRGLVDDIPDLAAALGRLRLYEDAADRAIEVTDEPIGVIEAKGIWISGTEIAPVRVEGLLAAGRAEEATGLVTRFARGLRGRDAPAPRAALATCRALLAAHGSDPARAEVAYARAARAWEGLPRPYDALLARERQAGCLLAGGRVERGVSLLSDTFQSLATLGATGDADRLARRLREYGVDVRRDGPPGRRGYGDQLSPRELEVVRLVAAGKTNRQIAAALSKSPPTVDGQLGSAMRKLGVSTRTELAVAALEAGIVT